MCRIGGDFSLGRLKCLFVFMVFFRRIVLLVEVMWIYVGWVDRILIVGVLGVIVCMVVIFKGMLGLKCLFMLILFIVMVGEMVVVVVFVCVMMVLGCIVGVFSFGLMVEIGLLCVISIGIFSVCG